MLKRLFLTLALVALAAVPAQAALGIAQNSTIAFAMNSSPTVTLPGAPTAGNVVVEECGSGGTATVNTTSWTVIASGGTAPGGLIYAGYRYVVGGDSSTLPAFFITPGTFKSCFAYEISGVSGTWTGHDFEQSDAQYQKTTSPVATNSVTTTHANDLVILGMFNYWGTSSGSNITGASGYTIDNASNNFTDYGAVAMAHAPFTSSSSNISTSFTVSETGSSNPSGYIAVVLAPSASAVPSPSLTLTGSGP